MPDPTEQPDLRHLTDRFLCELAANGSADQTLDLYSRTFTHLHRLSLTLRDFARPDLIACVRAAAPPEWKRSTLTTHLTRVATFANWLTLQGLTTTRHRAPSASKHPKLRDLPTDEEIEHLLADLATRTHHAPEGRARTRMQDEIITRILIDTGARISEVLRLENSAILRDQHGPRVVILGTKSAAAQRALVITPELHGLIHGFTRRWPPPQRTLFRSRSGQPIAAQTFCKWLRSYCLTLGIVAPITPHVFRHRWILQRICAGDSAIEVMTRAGHSSIEMTVYYFNQVRRLMPSDDGAQDPEIKRVRQHQWRNPTR